MAEKKKLIFRASAYDRYLRSKEEAVLPQLMAPRAFLFLWAFLVLLVVFAAVVFLARVPVLARGVAAVVRWDGSAPLLGEDVALVVVLPAEYAASLTVGMPIRLRVDESSDADSVEPVELLRIEPGVLSPEQLHARFRPSGPAAMAFSNPAAVGVARWSPPGVTTRAEESVGSVFVAETRVGTKRLASVLPWIDGLVDS